MQVIQGLVKPEDMPKADANHAGANGHAAGTAAGNGAAESTGVDAPAVSAPLAPPPDPRATARQEAGVGIGLADDLRAIRTALVKAHLATDFEAAFDLTVFQMVRAVFAHGYTTAYHALDIAFKETADRPAMRMNDDGFAASSPGEAMLADWSDLPFDWMEADDDAACFEALRNLPRADKEKLFAAAVARTIRGQLAFEHEARPELEATVARLGIEFATHVRPTADMVWSRLRKDRILAIARDTLGPSWASARSKYRKADLAKAMEEAFAAGKPPVGIGADEHAAALAWTPPGFAAFDAGGQADDTELASAADSADVASSNGAETAPVPPGDQDDATVQTDRGNGHDASARERNDVPASGNGAGDAGHSAADAGVTDANGETAGEAADVPEFLRQATQTQ